MILPDPLEFVQHCVEAHGMDEEVVFNIPTTRAYHDFLHEAKRAACDHTHEETS